MIISTSIQANVINPGFYASFSESKLPAITASFPIDELNYRIRLFNSTLKPIFQLTGIQRSVPRGMDQLFHEQGA